MKLKTIQAFLTTRSNCIKYYVSFSKCSRRMVVPTENVEILCNAPITADGVEFAPHELGKGIEGAKLRFTYYSSDEKANNAEVIGIAGIAFDDRWTWLQAASEPGLTTGGYGVENVQEFYYDELVELSDIGTNALYVFATGDLRKDQMLRLNLLLQQLITHQ